MTTAALLAYLRSLDVELWAEGDRLRYSTPKGVLTPALRAELVAHKEEILALLRQNRASARGDSAALSPFSRSSSMPRDGAWPLSFAQQRLWFLDQLEAGSPLYNIPIAIRLQGMLSVMALEQSLDEMVQRHEVLRTTFPSVESKPVQRISPRLQVQMPVVDLTLLPEGLREVSVQQLAQDEAVSPFNLARGPLLRAHLLRMDRQEYVLLLSLHHIVADDWSLGVLLRELSTLYVCCSAGKSSPLSALPMQYADFAFWQREYLQGEVLETQLAYWREQLAGAPSVLTLPTDRSRPPVQTFQGARHSFALHRELSQELKVLSQREGVTLFMVLLAAWATFLSRYSGQEDLLVGTPIANRTHAHLEGLIGCIVNMLVLRCDLSGDLSFRTLLERVRETTLQAYAHQDLPFEYLVEALQLERDLSHSPLFQVMFALQNESPMESFELPGLRLRVLEAERTTAKFDVTLMLRETAQGLQAVLDYNTDLFEAATIARMARHWQQLLEGLVDSPDLPLSRLPLLTPIEQQHALLEWNATWTDYPRDRCLHHLFEVQAARTPEAIAVTSEDGQLTYQELNRRANQLAHHLQALGVRPERLVGICLERSLEMMIALVAILKAGGAYVPLDPAYPAERLSFILEETRMPVLLTQQRLLAGLPQHSAHEVLLDTMWEAIAREHEENPISRVTAGNLAYVIYTSGSTGRPKGVQIAHRAVVNFLHAMRQHPGLTGQDRLLSITSLSFDIAALELFLPLMVGAQVMLVSREVGADGPQLCQKLAEVGATAMQATPTTWQLLVQAEAWDGSHLKILCGGEALSQKLARQLGERGISVWNLYGPTETTIWSSIQHIKSTHEPISLGRPIANTQTYVLNSYLQPMPVGVAGELYIGGDGVARGYLNRPELTAERFIPDPFSAVKGTRLYKTGDLARYRPDGTIEFMGRLDHQVKLRGYRIELGEIEATLRGLPGVQEAVVLVGEVAPGDKRLVAYVVASPQQRPTVSDIRDYVQARLPDYMLPSAFVQLETLPLTPNGKIDRRALPLLDSVEFKREEAYIAPRSPIEEVLTAIWADVLRLEQVGIHDDFFALGGHSLLATQAIARARETLQVELPLRTLFEAPTVASLAERIATTYRTRQGLRFPPLRSRARAGDVPLAIAQQRLWFLDQFEAGSPIYIIPLAVNLQGALHVEALEQSLNEVVQRHEVLRTTFPSTEGRPVQHITPTLNVQVPVVDLTTLSESLREAHVQRLVRDEARVSFDLARGPLLRGCLLRIDQQEHVLLLSLHHIVVDGWSLSVLLRELSLLYVSRLSGKPSPLPALSIQYTDFALWQREYLQGEILENQLVYWKEQLASAPQVLSLPTDRPRPAVQTFQGARHVFTLPRALWVDLKDLSRREGVTLFMTLLAAWQILLLRYSGQDDLLVGTPIANRTHAQLEGLIGFFVNTLVLRGDLSGNPDFRTLLGRVREVCLGAYAHQDLPFEQLVEALQPQRDLSHTPLFQVMFALQNTPREFIELPGLRLRPLNVEQTTVKFELTLTVQEAATGLTGSLEYNSDLFEPATIIRMAGHFQQLLEGIVSNPEQPLSRLSLLTEAEQYQLLVERNATQQEYSREVCLHQLFEQQVERCPEAIALVSEDEHLTYGELNRCADQLAYYLQSLGVRPDVRVGLCLPRSLDLIVSVLGILKAGGAYVPLDPNYPPERLAFMLADAQVSVLLTQQELIEQFPEHQVRLICLDSDSEAIARARATNASRQVCSENLAYVIYTSGSTGQPKGVMVSHQAIGNRLSWGRLACQLTERDHLLQVASFSFDIALWEIFGPLQAGARLVMARPGAYEDPTYLISLIVRQQITIAHFVPTLLSMLVETAGFERCQGLRWVLYGGEASSPELPRNILRRLDTGLQQFYGPTEASINATCWICQGEQDADSVSIGRPIGNTQVYLLDEEFRPVPIGVVGEVYIGGEGLAYGYLRRADITAERFVPNPWSQRPGARLYRTGDLARYLPNGNIAYMGRRDEQVKLRGYRIELGEIEATLRMLPAVQDAVVLLREDRSGEKRLVGYVVLHRTQACSVGELRRSLQERLPRYMVPSSFILLDELPLTPNGKIDRRMLSALVGVRPESFVAPRTPAEARLASIWATVLKREFVGVHDNFFELGGDSILSIQVITQARQAGLHVTPKQVFEHQTIAELASVVDTLPATQAEQDLVTGPVLLTPIQHWFFEQQFTDPHHFNQTMLLQVPHKLDVTLLEQVLRHLVLHHDALRLRFISRAEGWQQISMGPQVTIPLLYVDLTVSSATTWRTTLETIATQAQASLKLSEGPLLRVVLFDLGSRQPMRLLLVSHHLIIDWVSWRILLTDLQLAYQQVARGESIHLPLKTTSFQQWALRLSEYAHSASLQQELAYWLTQERTRIAPLPRDYPKGSNTRASARSLALALSQEETRALLYEAPAAYHTQVNDLLLTALVQAFAAWTGTGQLLLDLEGHGREEILEGLDLSRTVGWFTTVFPALLDLTGAGNTAEAIKAIKEQLRRIPQRGIGYGLLRYLSGDADNAECLRTLPQAEVRFNYLGQFDQIIAASSLFELARESSGPASSSKGRRSYLLEVNGLVVQGQLRIVWGYSEQVHKQTTIEQLAQGYMQALRLLIAHCQSPEAGGYTPSDFPQARLSQHQLDRFIVSIDQPRTVSAKLEHLEDIYELSPMQQGMLFHTLYAPVSGVYVEQISWRLRGSLNVAAFKQAWQQVIDQYPVLRTAFYWQGLEIPLQVVFRQVNLPWHEQDWREMTPEQQQEQLVAYLDADRQQDFDLAQVPLMRLCLIRLTEDTFLLLWSSHHALLDGWSLPLLIKDVFACYEAISRGERCLLEARRPYRDYIAWLQQQDLTQAQAFWRQALRGLQVSTPLGVDSPATEWLTHEQKTEMQQVRLSATLNAALRSLAKQQQVTLNTLVQGAWALLLSRYSGQEEVVFGVTVSGRPADLVGVESMIGLFINTLPLRVQVSPTSQLASWLQHLQGQQTEWRQYEYSPLAQVQQWSEGSANVPLFESIVVFENYPMGLLSRERKEGIEVEQMRAYEQTNYALTFVASPGTEFVLQINYETPRFDASSIKRMLGHLQVLLEGMVAYPHQSLADLSLLTAQEKLQLLIEWNTTQSEYSRGQHLHQLFEEQAERIPEAIALVYEDEQLTYRELDQQANQLAHHLQALGVGPDVLVGLCLERSLALVMGLLAILKAGGAYMPLDPAYPTERLAFMLQDAQAPVLLTHHSLLGRLPSFTGILLCLDHSTSLLASQPTQPPFCQIDEQNLAYVLYTSGSTGRPKGVALPHRALTNLLCWHRFTLLGGVRTLQFASLSFDVSCYELFVAWGSGGTVWMASEELRHDVIGLAQALITQAVEKAILPVITLQNLAQEYERQQHWPQHLREVTTTGEQLHLTPSIRQWFQKITHCRLHNHYGPTESHVVTAYSLEEEVQCWPNTPSIGRPIANTQIYILDRQGQPVPVGVIGELYIGGVNLARGYLGRAELTAERFVPHPWSLSGGERLYRTGDLARYQEDGTLEYHGRADQQVKLRGYRVELGEIEGVLREYEGVREPVVLLQEGQMGEKRLVAYITTSSQQQLDSRELRSYLLKQLPEYMVPSVFVLLETLPLSPNGKLDRRALPALDEVELKRQGAYAAPRGPIEEALASIWAEVLRLEQIGIYENFFELGGHSLLATQAISRVREALQIELPLRALFEAPTVAGLSERIATRYQAEHGLPVVLLHPSLHERDLPLSFAQQRLWFLDQLQAGSTLYNISAALRLQGALNVAVLERCFNEIVQRHEALRTTFPSVDGRPVQHITPTLNVQVPVVDLAALSVSLREAQVQQLAREEAASAFDLVAGPLLRVHLLRMDHQEHVLLLTIHHIVSDGWSLGVLVRELSLLYASYSTEKPSPLPALPIQYADYTLWQHESLREVLQTQLSYWREQLAGASLVLELPTDRPRPAVQTFRGARHLFALPKALSEELKALSQREGVTLFMTLLAAFVTLLSRYSGQDDLLVGTPIANRTHAQLEDLIGCFINTLVLRSDLSRNPSFQQLLRRVREVCLGAYTYQDVPFEQVVEAIQPQRDLSHTPLFQVMFALQNVPTQNIELPGLSLRSMAVEQTMVRYELMLTLQETRQGLLAVWEYNRDLFEAATIVRMAQQWQRLLEGIVADTQLPLSRLPLLTAEEQRQILLNWNATRTDYPQDQLLHHLFEEQAIQTPEAIAVTSEGSQLTYQELDMRANQLACHLQRLGIAPEVLVGVCMERSLELVVALLGILKAGGAYVPLDPSYPRERLAFMLLQSQAPVVLTEAHLLAQLPQTSAHLLCLTRDWPGIHTEPTGQYKRAVEPQSLAYVIYTSGSTGMPKGAMNTHRGICNRLLWMQATYGLTAADRVLHKTPLSFDVSVWELFWPLVTGAQLVIARPAGHQDSSYLLSLIEEQQITTLHFVPTMLQVFLKEAQRERARSLHHVMCSGEALSFGLQQQFAACLDADLHNLYGPTEAAIDVTSWACQPGREPYIVPIGRPIANTQIYLLDPHLQPVPIGVIGEVYIGGVGLARGYLNQAELTAECFIADPFGAEPGGRLYRTGDLARYWPDGAIEFVGRRDQQVKLRGYRIELGEIEVVLSSHEQVREVVVQMQGAHETEKRLVAYVVLKREGAVTVDELRRYLQARLPEYMIPAVFVWLPTLPLLPNGKLDRRALPLPGPARPELEEQYVGPRTPIEEILVGIWGHVLGVEQVGIHDNFFALGGDSIRSIQVLALLKQQRLSCSLTQLFQQQTIARLAEVLTLEAVSLTASVPSQPFSLIASQDRQRLPQGVEDAYPLTMLQAGMIFHSEYSPKAAIYHDIFSLHLRVPLDLEILRTTIQELVIRHPVLRTSFDLTSFSVPLQLVHRSVVISLPAEDWRHLSTGEQEERLSNWITAEKEWRFDWSRAPLLRFEVFHRSEETFQLTLSFHHAILDGWSLASLFTELLERYVCLLDNVAAAPAPPPVTPYRDYVALEQQAVASKEARDYWITQMRDRNNLPLARWPSLQQLSITPQLQVIRVPIAQEVAEGLTRLARAASVPLKSVLLAAHLRVMSLLSGQSDVLTGLVSNGRPETLDGEQVLGLFLNTVPHRQLLHSGSWLELVRETFEREREAFSFRRYPLAQIQQDQGGHSLFETIFNFTRFHVYERLQGLSNLQVVGGNAFEQGNFTLLANFRQGLSSEQVYMTLECDASQLPAEQIEAISGYYARTLAAMASAPTARYERQSLLSAREGHQLLFDWNAIQQEYPQDRCLHQLFEEQVEQTPEAIAVVCEEEQMSYGELNACANQLAHRLRALGVGPERLVGLCLERSLEMIVGVLGILKAGGAYMPLDPSYPAERLVFMLQDAQAAVVLTQWTLRDRLPAFGGQVLCLERGASWLVEQPSENLTTTVLPQHLAYVIYTSGSTGTPKGVMITHANTIRLFAATWPQFHFSAQDVWTLFHSIAFDFSVWELWGALLSGGRLVLVPYWLSRSPQDFWELLSREQVTVLNQTPSALRLLLGAQESAGKGKLPALRLVICGGEVLELSSVQQWWLWQGYQRPQLVNMYGITETTVHVTSHKLTTRDLQHESQSLIGHALDDLQVYVLDAYLQPVPLGVPGEIYVGGAGLARGYLRQPTLTAERFVPHPWSQQEGSRLYKTGDLARYLPDGNIEYLGRNDQQVKIRGYRIELGEIAAVLNRHPAVKESLIVVQEDGPNDKRLVAYVVPDQHRAFAIRQALHPSGEQVPAGKTDNSPAAIEEQTWSSQNMLINDLSKTLQTQVPAYMIPSAFVLLEAIPLTPNGKVNHRALPPPQQVKQVRASVPPSTPVEKKLAKILDEVLGVDKINLYDSFFTLGGHSLSAIQLISRIRNTFEIELPLRVLFETPTIAELASAITLLQLESADQEAVDQLLAELAHMSDEEVRNALLRESNEREKDNK